MQKLTIKNKEQIRKDIQSFLQSNPQARYIHRLHALLLLIDNQANNCTNLGKLFNNSPRALSNWVHKVNRTGSIETLKDKQKPGRKPRLTEQQIEMIKQTVQQPPQQAGINVKAWNGQILSHYIEQEFGVALKVRQCQRVLKKTKSNNSQRYD